MWTIDIGRAKRYLHNMDSLIGPPVVEQSKYAAGVLPFTFDPSGETLVLLGKDYNGFWSDFGGRSEMSDLNDVIQTASREFWEETNGLISSVAPIREWLITHTNFHFVSKTPTLSNYHMFLMHVPYANYRTQFRKTHQLLRNMKRIHHSHAQFLNRYLEVHDIAWFPLNSLLANQSKLRLVFKKTLMMWGDHVNQLIDAYKSTPLEMSPIGRPSLEIMPDMQYLHLEEWTPSQQSPPFCVPGTSSHASSTSDT